MHRIAVLDDDDSVAGRFADWSLAPAPVDIVGSPTTSTTRKPWSGG